MRLTITLLFVCASALGMESDPTEARVTFAHKEGKTDFSYDLKLGAETLSRVDRTIFTASFVGILSNSETTSYEDSEDKTYARGKEVESLAKKMKAATTIREMANVPVGTVPQLEGIGSSAPPAEGREASLELDFSAAETEMDTAEKEFSDGEWAAGYHRLGKLGFFLVSLPEDGPLQERWRALRQAYFEDGLLRLPAWGGKAPARFLTARKTIEGRILRQLANGLGLKGQGTGPELAYLLLLDEFTGKSIPSLRVEFQKGGPTLPGAVLSALEGSGSFRSLKALVQETAPELRTAIFQNTAIDLKTQRKVDWEGSEETLTAALKEMLE